jgi:membrane-associated phospholipid phosphatase
LPLTLVLLATLAPVSAFAQPDVLPDGSPYQVRWVPDLVIAGLAAAVWIGPQPFADSLVSPKCPCDRNNVPGFDRWAIGHSSQAARTVSHLGVGAMLVIPAALDVIDVRRHEGTWAGAGKDLVVIGEAVLINGALNEVVKLAVRRPRPQAYDTENAAVLADTDSYLSFYSGHSSTAFAAGMAYATTFALRHPESGYRYLVYGGVVAGGSTVGLLRVLGGRHFPSDVLVGALVGSAVGITVPLLHRRPENVNVLVSPDGVALVGTF